METVSDKLTKIKLLVDDLLGSSKELENLLDEEINNVYEIVEGNDFYIMSVDGSKLVKIENGSPYLAEQLQGSSQGIELLKICYGLQDVLPEIKSRLDKR